MSNLDRQNDELEALSYLIPEGHYTPLDATTIQMKFYEDEFSYGNPQYCPLLITLALPAGYPIAVPPSMIKFEYEPCRMRLVPEKLASNGWFGPVQQADLRAYLNSELWHNEEMLFDFYQYLSTSLPYPTQSSQGYQNNADLLRGGGDGGDEASASFPSSPSSPHPLKPTPNTSTAQTNTNPQHSITPEQNPTLSTEAGSGGGGGGGGHEHSKPPQLYVGARPYKTPTVHHTKQQVFEILQSKYNMTQLEHFVVQKSTFITRIFPITDYSTVVEILSLLYCLKEVATATHTMVVYRYTTTPPVSSIETNNNTSSRGGHHLTTTPVAPRIVLGADEDGEDGAEKVQLNVMRSFDCSALVTVTRQFGGILLGPSRFKIIADLTREALEAAGYKRLEDKKR